MGWFGCYFRLGRAISRYLNANEPATSKQKAVLEKRGMWTPGMRKEEASKLISKIAEQEGW